MLDLSRLSEAALAPLDRVVTAALAAAPTLTDADVMIVGAVCRDLLHNALGQTSPMTATYDLDLALALSSWEAYRALATTFPRSGHTGVRFVIAGIPVDLLAFGAVEDPDGIVNPPTRRESVSVWAFSEILAAAMPLRLSSGAEIRLPTVAGYAAAKLGAWLDRSECLEYKDAADLGVVLDWYARSTEVEDRLYETTAGSDILVSEGADVHLASAFLLGADVRSLLGPVRTAELLERWPGDERALVLGLRFPARTLPEDRRVEMIGALTRGLTATPLS